MRKTLTAAFAVSLAATVACIAPTGDAQAQHPADAGPRREGADKPAMRDAEAWGSRAAVRRPHYGDWLHGHWSRQGSRPWSHLPASWLPSRWYAELGPAAYATPWTWGYFSYANPYHDPLIAGAFDYSRPLVTATAPGPAAEKELRLTDREMKGLSLLGEAKAAFLRGDYAISLDEVGGAIKLMPDDRVLHELRGLTLFALGRYKESAAVVYAVLADGPGWDWTTVSALYPTVQVYTRQLRKLERHVLEHPDDGAVALLLGYHYLVGGHDDAAAALLRIAAGMNPKDRLTAEIVDGISMAERGNGAGRASESTPSVAAAALVGNWVARRWDGELIHLSLKGDSKFIWTIRQGGEPKEFRGTYAVVDKRLVFKQGDNPVMAGLVRPLESRGFNFRISGDNPADTGLMFKK